jgi:hypothetical protein
MTKHFATLTHVDNFGHVIKTARYVRTKAATNGGLLAAVRAAGVSSAVLCGYRLAAVEIAGRTITV